MSIIWSHEAEAGKLWIWIGFCAAPSGGTVTTGSQKLFDLGLTGQLSQEQIAALQVAIAGVKVVR